MSVTVDVPKTEESVPVSKPVESTTSPAQETVPATTESHMPIPTETGPMGTMEPETTANTATVPETTKAEAVVEATPATEGVLAYKAPGLLNLLRKSKYFFWFSEEPLTKEALDSYVKNEKHEAHHNAAWAQETGKGVLFYAKRAEDKSNPSGMILLPEATAVTKVGSTDFSFKVGDKTHKFEASAAAERDSWVVAIEKIVEESAHLKSEVTGRESYKKTVEGYSFSPVVAGSASKATAPKKSLDAATATEAATAEPTVTPAAEASSASSVEDTKKAEKQAKKERSQSRKRSSVFGLFGKKDEDSAAKKAEKEHEKEVKEAEKVEKKHEKEAEKAEKEHIKEEKKHEAEIKKEEAKAEHDTTKAKEAAEAAAIAAAPVALVSAEKKHDEKADEEVTTPTEKKNKRASVFGGFFNKNKVTSPTTEKSEKDVVPEVLAKDETPAVSETAPKLDEPIETKPLDAAAVTAPVDTIATPAAPTQIETTEPKAVEHTPTTEAVVTPRTEKKSFLAGVFKKSEKKEEPKEEVKTNGEVVKEVAPVTAEPAAVATEPTVETPASDVEVAKEERPAREKRRTSLFGSLGTLKRKTEKSPEPSAVANTDGTAITTPRSKSPIPRLGGLFRKPSRATKPETTADEVKTESAVETPAPVVAAETPAHTTIVEPAKNDSAIVGDVVPESLTATSLIHDAVTVDPKEVKGTA